MRLLKHITLIVFVSVALTLLTLSYWPLYQPFLTPLLLLLHAPRWLVLLGLAFVGVLFIALSRRPVPTAVVFLLFVASSVRYSGFEFDGSASQEASALTLTTININLGRASSFDAVSALVDDYQPDVLALQECGPQFFSGFSLDGYVADQSGGLCVYSKWPLTLISSQKGSGIVAWRGTASATYDVDWLVPFKLVNVHLMTPRPALESMLSHQLFSGTITSNTIAREREAGRLAEQLKDYGVFLALGDFNLLPDSPIYRRHLTPFTNAFSERGTGTGLTKLYSDERFGVRIDHLLTSPAFRVIRSEVLRSVGSDHLPLLTVLELTRF